MMFELDHVCFGYDDRKPPVLADLSATIRPGTTTVVFGPSGAGKSTLLYLLGLLWDRGFRGGSITYRGQDYAGLDPWRRTLLRRREFGFALQSCYLLPHFTCVENVAMPLALLGHDLPHSLEVAAELIQSAGDPMLKDVQGLLARRASGGQQQRVAVLRAMVHGPRVLFADEPFSSLDEDARDIILGMLRKWRQQPDGAESNGGSSPPPGDRTLVLVCHDADVAYDEGDEFLVFNRSRRLARGAVLPKSAIDGPDHLRRLTREGDPS